MNKSNANVSEINKMLQKSVTKKLIKDYKSGKLEEDLKKWRDQQMNNPTEPKINNLKQEVDALKMLVGGLAMILCKNKIIPIDQYQELMDSIDKKFKNC